MEKALYSHDYPTSEVTSTPPSATFYLYSDPTRSRVVIWVKIFKTEKIIEKQLVRLTEVYGNILSQKNTFKSVKTALLLSNVIDADHQNSCLFTNKGLYGF